jgi:hypothetical protein
MSPSERLIITKEAGKEQDISASRAMDMSAGKTFTLGRHMNDILPERQHKTTAGTDCIKKAQE